MKDLLVEIAKAMVDSPDQVLVNEIEGKGQTIVLELRVAKEDLGKVIGKQGRNANAIRNILSSSGRKNNKNVLLEIIEE